MRAVIINEFGGIDKLRMGNVPKPEALPGEVVIKVENAGINPVDWKIREGWLKNFLPHRFPLVLGWDAAGTIDSVGVGVEEFMPGDRVFAYCRKEVVQEGTFAEFVSVPASNVAKIPSNLSFEEAASIPLVALTAWQALKGLRKGQTALIHAGSGGVGSLAIQFAKLRGAKVYTTTGHTNIEYVKSLGADVAIDYTKEDFSEVMEPVDFVLDSVGGEVLEKSFSVIKKGGSLVTITDLHCDRTRGEPFGVDSRALFVSPNGEELAEIARLIESEKLQIPDIEVYPLEEVGTALEESRGGHTRGKIVLQVTE